MPSALYPEIDYAKQVAERRAQKREEAEASFIAATVEAANGHVIAPERVEELCQAAEKTPQDFENAVHAYSIREVCAKRLDESSTVQTERDDLTAKRGQLVASYEKQLADLDSKIGDCDTKLREADKARQHLLNTMPPHVFRAVRQVRKKIRKLESFVGSYLGLTDHERSLIHSSFNGGGYEAWPGVNAAAASAAVAAVNQRAQELEDRKTVAQGELAELRAEKNRLLSCALLAIPTDEDLEAAKSGS